MEELLASLDELPAMLLVLLRVSMFVVLLPVIGHRLVPAPVKIGLIAFLSALIYPIVRGHVPDIPSTPLAWTVAAVQEILLTGMIALFAHLIFASAQFAGQIVSYQMGLAIANVMSPATNAQVAVVGQFFTILAMLVWISVGAHEVFLAALLDSFRLMPIGHAWSFQGLSMLIDMGADMFLLALRLAAPMMLLLFFLYVALGLLARAVPQIQVFFVSFPLTIAVGFAVFSLSMSAIVLLMQEGFGGLAQRVHEFLLNLSGA